MERIVTLTERKATETERRRRAVDELRALLTTYACAHGGRFLLFGSAARGDMRHRSDVDLLVAFPSADADDDAWRFAEQACWDRDLYPDIMPAAWCKPAFLERIRHDVVVLG